MAGGTTILFISTCLASPRPGEKGAAQNLFKHLPYKFAECMTCEMFFPLQSPGSPRGGHPQKMGKNYKIPLPAPTPENGEKLPEKKNTKNVFSEYFCNFSVIFPHFRGLDRGGEFCNFSPFFGDFRPGGFRSAVRGKTTRNA